MNNPLLHRWPKVRPNKNGTQIVKGWYTVQWRFAVLHRCSGVLIRILGLLLIFMAFLPLMSELFNLVPEGTIWFALVNELAQLRQWPLYKLQELAPDYSQQLWLHPAAAFNWVYLLAGLVMYRMVFLFAGPLARLLGVLLPPLIKRPVKVRIDQQRVRFWRWGWPRRYHRQPGLPVQFFCEQSQNAPHPSIGREPTFLTIMRYGHRKIVIGSSMHHRDAQRLALGLSHARDETDGAGNMQGTGGVGGFPTDYGMPFGI